MNQILLIACLAAAPELTYTPTGTPIFTALLAGERSVITRDGETKSIPFYVQVQRLGKYAEQLAERDFAQGDVLMVDGQLDYSAWEKDGAKLSAVRVKITGGMEQAAGNFETVTDAAGGVRLKGGHNHVTLQGHLGADVELRYTPSGDAVADLRVAVNESWTNGAGSRSEKTHWITVTAWRELAEQVKDLKKGDSVMIEGALVDEGYTDRGGNKRRQQKVEASMVLALKKRTAVSTSTGTFSPQHPGNPREHDWRDGSGHLLQRLSCRSGRADGFLNDINGSEPAGLLPFLCTLPRKGPSPETTPGATRGMTRHHFTFRRPKPELALSIDCGWDRPLQYFYLNVEQLGADQGEEMLYCSLGDPRLPRGGLTLHELRERFEELCIILPVGLLEALADDQRVNRGNAETTWP